MSRIALRAPFIGLSLFPLTASAAEGGLQLLPELPAPIAELVGAPAGWGTILLIAFFVVLLFPVNRLLFAPLLRVLDQREERISGTRARAEKLEREAAGILARYERSVAETRAASERERRSLLEEVRREAQAENAAARREAEQRIEGARREVGQALESARSGLRAEAAELARQAASQVLGRAL